ncbi:MAG: helix-turn-helix domain-containing protein [Chloroflexi bacterium]|nr:helix-turn-helix domain-containing protein [Chloroflexota bacterium]
MSQQALQLLSTREAAAQLGIHPTTLTRAVHRGLIRPARVTPGGFLRFTQAELDHFLAQRLNNLADRSGRTGAT